MNNLSKIGKLAAEIELILNQIDAPFSDLDEMEVRVREIIEQILIFKNKKSMQMFSEIVSLHQSSEEPRMIYPELYLLYQSP